MSEIIATGKVRSIDSRARIKALKSDSARLWVWVANKVAQARSPCGGSTLVIIARRNHAGMSGSVVNIRRTKRDESSSRSSLVSRLL